MRKPSPRRCLPSLALALATASCAAPDNVSPPERRAATDAAITRVRSAEALVGRSWRWERFESPVEAIEVAAPDRYTLAFAADGSVALQADCNRGAGRFRVPEDGRIAFTPFAVTLAACPPGSQDTRYLRELGRATSFFVEGDRLFLELPVDSGALHFRAAP